MYKMYLDDLRNPENFYDSIARSFDEAITLIKINGMPSHISFDHDLGSEKSGYDLAKWIVEKVSMGDVDMPDDFSYNVHSANPVGVKNIQQLLDTFLEKRRSENVQEEKGEAE